MAFFRGLGAVSAGGDPNIEPLTVETAARLRIPLFGRFSNADLVSAVQKYPDLAFVAHHHRQYALGSHWRRRPEIGEIVEVSRGVYRRQLAERLIEQFRQADAALIILDFEEGANEAPFYHQLGFKAIDRIVEYERPGCNLDAPVAARQIRPYRRGDRSDAAAVLAIERESFPWLWWNSPAELAAYESTPDVEMFVALDNIEPVGYAGITVRGAVAHLDRLAVKASRQRHGYGAALVAHCLGRLSRLGVRRVTLSTQEDNYRSRSLYERLGFRLGRWTYDIRGLWLQQPEDPDSGRTPESR
jgi:ribosomal protein S18 acetylase RimI-like enzyme